jgi:hypothetical protein
MTVIAWNLAPPAGFRGLDPEKPLSVYYRHLPHWRQDGASYFVTFRLADSLPQTKLQELALRRTEWEKAHPPPRTPQAWEEFARQTMTRVESWLDQGMGACWLRQPWAARIVEDGLHFFDGSRYEFGSLVVMPNHVHAIVRPLQPMDQPLEKILQSRKRTSARRINATLGREGELWQQESFDRIIRDEEHLYRCIQYIGNNPRRANIPRAE